MKHSENLNIPNILSIFRLCMVPVFAVVYFTAPESSARYWALAVYIIAQGTDALDGYIARKYKLITRLGRVLDPLADKLMTFTVVVCIIVKFQLPYLWWAAVILFVKEMLMGIGALVQYKRVTDVPPSNIAGKLSTIYFYVLIIAVLLLDNSIPKPVMLALFIAAMALTLTAFALYILKFYKIIRQGK